MVSKSPDAFRTISEVAEILEIPAHVLRFWESRFTQIKPVKRGGGRRYYRPQDIDLLRGIRDLLYSEGMTIKGVQKILREKGIKHVAGIGHLDPHQDPVLGATERPDPPLRRPKSDTVPTIEPEAAEARAAKAPTPEPIIDAERPEPVPEAPFWAEPDEEDPMDQAPVPTQADGEVRPADNDDKAPAIMDEDEAPFAEVEDEIADEEPVAAEIAPEPETAPLRSFPDAALPQPGRSPRRDTQVDLFSHAEKRDRRPFPPDPARAARAEEMRRILSKLETLREKMASNLR
ncbi:MerR family transcriptional regulator [Halovulum sp. GXIMD14794]